MTDTTITVPVPAERVPEFYQFFGRWLAGTLSLPGTSTKTSQGNSKPSTSVKLWGGTDEDLEDAALLWSKFSPRARAMFSLLIENPGSRYTGDQIAAAVGIPNGAHGVAGVLAWPGRHGQAIGRGLPSSWQEDPETLESHYWMSPERADLFKAAREKAEGATQ